MFFILSMSFSIEISKSKSFIIDSENSSVLLQFLLRDKIWSSEKFANFLVSKLFIIFSKSQSFFKSQFLKMLCSRFFLFFISSAEVWFKKFVTFVLSSVSKVFTA